ncbi:MAG: succinylglutamate desuccinylase/aspartoacylase family protein, partial [Candidatus Bathyarchaeia archaeon]
MPDSSVLSIPIGVARGSEDGPILCVTSGVHGDEYEGPWAIADVFKELNPRSMKGTFIGIPVVNVLAYPYGSRTTPLDQKDLARFFPGNKNGTVSEQIAYKITEEIIKKSDYVIDLHSGGTDYRYLDMVCYFDVPGNLGEKSFNLAHTFPVKVIFRSEEKPIGRLIDAAIEVGVPSIGTECSGEGRYNEKKKNIYVSGIKNALRYLGIIKGLAKTFRIKRTYIDFKPIVSDIGGFFKPKVKLNEKVLKGDKLGSL